MPRVHRYRHRKIPVALRTRRRDGSAFGDGIAAGSNYSAAEAAFLKAIDEFKRANNRPKPAWAEVLQVLRQLGWRQREPAGRRRSTARGKMRHTCAFLA